MPGGTGQASPEGAGAGRRGPISRRGTGHPNHSSRYIRPIATGAFAETLSRERTKRFVIKKRAFCLLNVISASINSVSIYIRFYNETIRQFYAHLTAPALQCRLDSCGGLVRNSSGSPDSRFRVRLPNQIWLEFLRYSYNAHRVVPKTNVLGP